MKEPGHKHPLSAGLDLAVLESQASAAAKLLKLLANEKRLALVYALWSGEKNAGELTRALGISQSGVSQHLALLRAAGLVAPRRHGTAVFYSLNRGQIQPLLRALAIALEK